MKAKALAMNNTRRTQTLPSPVRHRSLRLAQSMRIPIMTMEGTPPDHVAAFASELPHAPPTAAPAASTPEGKQAPGGQLGCARELDAVACSLLHAATPPHAAACRRLRN